MHRSGGTSHIRDTNKMEVITRPDHLYPTWGTSSVIAPAYSPDDDDFPDVIHEDARCNLREN